MASRSIAIRLSLQDADTFRTALNAAGAEGQAALGRITANSNEAARALDAVTIATQKAAQAQAAINASTGVGGSGFDYASRAADLAAYSAEMDRTRAKYDPLFAASKRYEQALEGISAAERQGAISAQIAARAREQETAAFSRGYTSVVDTTKLATNTFSGLRQIIGQAGYQVGDFAVQVQGGTSALTALSQQGSQFLGVFGPAGAVAGAALTIGTIAVQMLRGADAAKEAKDAAELLSKAYEAAGNAALSAAQKTAQLTQKTYEQQIAALSKQRGELVGEINQLQADTNYLTSAGAANAAARRGTMRAGSLGIADRQQAESDALAASTITTQGEDLQRRLSRNTEALSQLEAQAARAQKAVAAGLDPGSIDRSFASFQSAVDKRSEILEKYRQTVAGIQIAAEREGKTRAETDKVLAQAATQRDEALRKLTESENKLTSAQRAANREAENRVKIDAGRDPLTGYSNDVTIRLDALRKSAEQKEERSQEALRKRISEDASREQAKQQAEINRATDSVVDYAGDAFADLFRQNGKGWAGMLDTFEDTARATFARIAAEAIIRPIVTPVVSGLFGGTGSAASSVGALGGLADTFGLSGAGAQLSSVFGLGSLTSGASGLLGTTLWGDAAAATNTALAGMGPGVFGPATPSAVALTGQAPLTLGGLIGGTGAGFAAGSALNGLLGGNKLGGSIGSGGGALAGAAIGSVVPGIGTLAGGLIGGLAGGGLGGLFGNERPSDRTGTFTSNLLTGETSAGGLEGKKFSQENRDSAKKIADTITGLGEQLRQAIGASSTPFSFQTAVGGRDGLSLQYGGETYKFDASDAGTTALVKQAAEAIVQSMASQTSSEIQKIIAKSDDADALVTNIGWFTSTYKVLSGTIETAQTAADRFDVALAGTNKTYDDAITKANQLGLETAKLADNQAAAISAARAAQGAIYDQASRTAQGRDYVTQLEATRTYYNDNSALARQLGRDPEALFNSQVTAILAQLDLSQLVDVSNSFAGWDDAVSSLATQTAANARATEMATAAAEASTKAQQDRASAESAAATSISSVTDYIRKLQFSDASTLTSAQQAGLAESQFSKIAALAAGGDVSSIGQFSTYAQQFIDSQAAYGAGPAQALATQRVLDAAGQIGQVSADALTSSAMADISETQTQTLVNKLDELQKEMASVKQELRSARLAAA